MNRLPSGQMVKAIPRESRSDSAGAGADPGQRGVKIIAAVLENGSDLQIARETFGAFAIGRPDRGRQAVAAVVHPGERFFIVGNGRHGHERTEALLLHHPGVIRHIGQERLN
jgi:hypothetical protein